MSRPKLPALLLTVMVGPEPRLDGFEHLRIDDGRVLALVHLALVPEPAGIDGVLQDGIEVPRLNRPPPVLRPAPSTRSGTSS